MHPADLHQVLDLAQAIAAELAAEAVDPEADLTMNERRALVGVALAVEAHAARVVGVVPRSAEAEAVLAKAILATINPPPPEC